MQAMWTPTLVLIAITTLAACATLGGGLYEYLVIDPYLAASGRASSSRATAGYRGPGSGYRPTCVFEALLDPSRWSRHGTTQACGSALLVALVSHAADADVVTRRLRAQGIGVREDRSREALTRPPPSGGPVAACCDCRLDVLTCAGDARRTGSSLAA